MQQLQQQILQNQIYAMNSMNSGMFPMFPFMPQMLNYQLYMEQMMKTNPYAAIQMQKMMALTGQNPQSAVNMPNLQNNAYIPFSKLPFPRQNLGESKKEEENKNFAPGSQTQVGHVDPNRHNQMQP